MYSFPFWNETYTPCTQLSILKMCKDCILWQNNFFYHVMYFLCIVCKTVCMYVLYKNRYFNFIYFNLFEKKINNDSQVFSYQICDRHNDHFMVLCFIVPTVYSNLNHIFSCVFVSAIYQVLRVVYISNNCNKNKNKKNKTTKNNKKQKQKRKQT